MGAKTSHNSDDESGDEYGIENFYYNNDSDADFYDTIDIDEDSDSTNYLDDAQYGNWTDDKNPQTRNDDVDQSDGNMNDRNEYNDDYLHDARNFEYWSQFPGSPDMFADDNDEDVHEQSPDNFADDTDEDSDSTHMADSGDDFQNAQYLDWTDDEIPQTRNDDVEQSDGTNMNDRNADNDDYQHDATNFDYWSKFPGSPDMFADDNDEEVRGESPDNFADDNDEHDKDTSHVFRRSVKRRKVEKNEGCDYCAICPACRKSRYKSVMDYYGEESDSDADSTK